MKTSFVLTCWDCCLPIPGINSDEYLNGKLPFVCCLVFTFDDDGLLVTVTRRIVSSLVVEDDDDVDDDDDDDEEEFDRCFFDSSDFLS